MKLAAYLADNGLTLAGFGNLLGVSPETVRRYRDFLRYPRPEHLSKIAEVTHGEVMPNDFMPMKQCGTEKVQ
jgi:DNA-binding transcriptional regulator YdaS (Cro superfamily)